MACGRLKNLEIAARNPLCGHGDRRRHSPTTGKVAGEGETPSHRQWANPGLRARTSPAPPARRKLRATRRGGNPGPPGNGRPRGLWPRGSPAPSGKGENPEPPRQRENFGPTGGGETPSYAAQGKALSHLGKGKTLSLLALGKPRVIWRKESSEPPARELFGVVWLGGNPELSGEEYFLSHRHGGFPSHLVIRATGTPAGC